MKIKNVVRSVSNSPLVLAVMLGTLPVRGALLAHFDFDTTDGGVTATTDADEALNSSVSVTDYTIQNAIRDTGLNQYERHHVYEYQFNTSPGQFKEVASFTVTPLSGVMNLEKLDLTLYGSGLDNPREYTWGVFVNGTEADTFTYAPTGSGEAYNNVQSMDLSAFSGLSSATLSIRFKIDADANNSDIMGIVTTQSQGGAGASDIYLNGVVVVPEPGSLTLLGLGGVAALWAGHKRRRH